MFCVVAALLSGGHCERIENEMQRRETMKRHYDSLLKEDRARKDSAQKSASGDSTELTPSQQP